MSALPPKETYASQQPFVARAQQPAMPVIGLLTARNLDFEELKSIQKGLTQGGYVEGRNLAIMYRSADGVDLDQGRRTKTPTAARIISCDNLSVGPWSNFNSLEAAD